MKKKKISLSHEERAVRQLLETSTHLRQSLRNLSPLAKTVFLKKSYQPLVSLAESLMGVSNRALRELLAEKREKQKKNTKRPKRRP